MNEPEIKIIKPAGRFRLPQFNWPKKPVLLIGVTLFLAVASVITAWLLYQRRAEPVAPTAPKPGKAAVLPTPAPTPPAPQQCIVAFTVLASPTPSPTPTTSPGPTPTPTPPPTVTPTPTPTPTPSGTPGPTPTPTPSGTPRPTPTPTPIVLGPTPTPVALEQAGSVAGTWTVSLAGVVLLVVGTALMFAL